MFIKEAEVTKTDEGIYFVEEGRKFISDDSWSQNNVSLHFFNIKDTIGFCPKYVNDNNFLAVSISPEEITIFARIKGMDKVYTQINNPTLLESNVLTYESLGETRHFFHFNGIELLQIDSSLFISGQVFICGKPREIIQKCVIEQMQSIAWTNNAGEAGISISTETIEKSEVFKLQSNGVNDAILYQNVPVEKDHAAISFEYVGAGEIYINGILFDSIHSDNFIRHSFILGHVDNNMIRIEFRTKKVLHVGKVQVEEKRYVTAYIPNEELLTSTVREGTKLSYPNKEAFLREEGSMYVKVTPQMTLQEHDIFRTDTEDFSLAFKNSAFVWEAMEQSVAVPFSTEKDKPIELFVTWSSYEISLSVNEQKQTNRAAAVPTASIDKLIFADSSYTLEPTVLEEWAVFQKEFSFNGKIQDHLKEASMHSLFDGGINGSNVSWAEIPVSPNDHSPILVEKANGEPLQKVSFFDSETGDYRTWNEEAFVYDGKSNHVTLSYSNVNELFSDIGIKTEDGEKIGAPYRVDGKKLYFTFSEYEKIMHKNKLLKAVYQVNDSYTVDYNVSALDGYRLDFTKHDGTDRFVYQEGNRFGEPVKLATMIEMNPIYNQNHTGFMYVSKTINKTEDFRITATPDRLRADGFSKSTVVIQPLDYQGNFLSHVHLSVKADKGFISRYIDKKSAEAQKRSGQYLYQYTAPFIYSKDETSPVEDHIWIIDEDSKIGICYKVILGPVDAAHPLQMTEAEKTLLDNKTVLMNAVIMYESLEEREAPELFAILDLNKDKKINLDEIDTLSTKERDFELSAIVQQLEYWKGDEKHASA